MRARLRRVSQEARIVRGGGEVVVVGRVEVEAPFVGAGWEFVREGWGVEAESVRAQ